MFRAALLLLFVASPLVAADPRLDPEGVPLPDGCLARLGSTRFRVWPGLQGPFFTPKGELRFIEADGETHRLRPHGETTHFRYMDAESGLFTQKRTLRESERPLLNTKNAFQIGLSSDGRTFTYFAIDPSRADTRWVFWNPDQWGEQLGANVVTTSGIPYLSSNHRWAAEFDRESGDVTLTNTLTGAKRVVCRVNPEDRPDLTPAPDGRTVLVATDDAATLHDVSGKRPPRTLIEGKEGHSLTGVKVRYSGDGGVVLVRAQWNTTDTLRACDARTGEHWAVKLFTDDIRLDSVTGLSADGKRMTISGTNRHYLADIRTGQYVSIPAPLTVRHVAFDDTGKRLAFRAGNRVVVCDAAVVPLDGGALGELSRPSDAPTEIAKLQFHDGGRILLAYGPSQSAGWSVASGRIASCFDTPKEWKGFPSPDGRRVLWRSELGAVKMCAPFTGKSDGVDWSALGSATSWQFTDDGKHLVAVGSGNGQSRVAKYDLKSGKAVGEPLQLNWASVDTLVASADGARVVVRRQRRDTVGGNANQNNFTRLAVGDTSTGELLHAAQFSLNTFQYGGTLSAEGGRCLITRIDVQDGGDASKPLDGIRDLVTGRTSNIPDAVLASVAVSSADGRAFAVDTLGERVVILEAASGGVRTSFQHKSAVRHLAFSPDNTVLAAASDDAPIYLWDVRGVLLNQPKSFDEKTGEALWVSLADGDAGKAFDAMRRLAAAPDSAVKLLAAKLPPVPAPTDAWVSARLTELADREFRTRERATAELEAVAEIVLPSVLAERNRTTSPEARQRLKRVADAPGAPTPDRLRALRAVEVLEWVRTPGAADVLRKWASGAPRAPLTVAAGRAVERMKR